MIKKSYFLTDPNTVNEGSRFIFPSPSDSIIGTPSDNKHKPGSSKEKMDKTKVAG